MSFLSAGDSYPMALPFTCRSFQKAAETLLYNEGDRLVNLVARFLDSTTLPPCHHPISFEQLLRVSTSQQIDSILLQRSPLLLRCSADPRGRHPASPVHLPAFQKDPVKIEKETEPCLFCRYHWPVPSYWPNPFPVALERFPGGVMVVDPSRICCISHIRRRESCVCAFHPLNRGVPQMSSCVFDSTYFSGYGGQASLRVSHVHALELAAARFVYGPKQVYYYYYFFLLVVLFHSFMDCFLMWTG